MYKDRPLLSFQSYREAIGLLSLLKQRAVYSRYPVIVFQGAIVLSSDSGVNQFLAVHGLNQ